MITEKKKCPLADEYDDLICIKGRLWRVNSAGRLLLRTCPKCVKATRGVRDDQRSVVPAAAAVTSFQFHGDRVVDLASEHPNCLTSRRRGKMVDRGNETLPISLYTK